MSQQHAHFEEESGGEPSDQISSAPRYEVPPWSSDQVEMPDHRLQARSLDRAQSSSSDLRVRTRFILALMSLIFLFVLVVVVIANPSFVSFITVFFVVLFAVLAVFLNLIFALQRERVRVIAARGHGFAVRKVDHPCAAWTAWSLLSSSCRRRKATQGGEWGRDGGGWPTSRR